MTNVPLSGDVSSNQVTTTVNGVIRDLEAMQTTQVFKDDTGQKRVLLGKGANDFYGLKVSAAGVDVHTATNSQLVFNSNQNVPKIVASGTTTLTAIAGTSVATAVDLSSLSLPSPPLAIVWLTEPWAPSTYFPVPFLQLDQALPNNTVQGLSWINYVGATKEIRFQATVGSTATAHVGVWTFKYYILQETAN